MLILTLINIQYLQNVVFSITKGLNDQNPSQVNFPFPLWGNSPLLLMLFGKPLVVSRNKTLMGFMDKVAETMAVLGFLRP